MKKDFSRWALYALLAMAGAIPAEATTWVTNAIGQYGITWSLDRNYVCGKFANGDYWVVGDPVKIVRISPDFDGANNGWEVNPVVSGPQGFDKDGGTFDSSLVPPLPYNASPGESIVKSVSSGKQEPYLQKAAVLTVLSAPPPDDGSTVFRPPYAGSEKPWYYVSDIRYDLLPQLVAPTNNVIDLGSVCDRFVRVQLDHKTGSVGRYLHPVEHMTDDYQPTCARDLNQGILRLMLNDSRENKMPPLVAILQAGIDAFHIVKLGQTWPPGGGYQPGHKLMLTFAATMLGNADMARTVREASFFNEDLGVYRSPVTGRALFGLPDAYGSEKTFRDPYKYIDGGSYPGGNYQPVMSPTWKGAVLTLLLMPCLQECWGATEFEEMREYVDRWVEHGALTLPDPHGRFPTLQGNGRDSALGYESVFVRAMWETYRQRCSKAPALRTSPLSLDFEFASGSNPRPKSIVIGPVSTSDAPFSVTSSEAWLTLNPASSPGTKPQKTVEVRCEGMSLPQGTYRAYLFVTSEADPGWLNSVRVSAIVHPAWWEEVIVDESIPADAATFQGTWTASTLGAYRHDGNTAKGQKWATFRPALGKNARYGVYVRHVAQVNRASNVPIDIYHAEGQATVAVNQRVNDGEWVHVGDYRFTAGTNGFVRIRTTGTDGYVIADAVRFVTLISAGVDVSPSTDNSRLLQMGLPTNKPPLRIR